MPHIARWFKGMHKGIAAADKQVGRPQPFELGQAVGVDLAADALRCLAGRPRAAGDAVAGPLSGLRVLDLSMGWSGPLGGRHYADLGADVIKVEGCGHPDWWRGWNGPEAGNPPPYELRPNFNAMNRNKRGITLDITSASGAELLRKLVKSADIVVESFAPGHLAACHHAEAVMAGSAAGSGAVAAESGAA